MLFDAPARVGIATRAIARIASSRLVANRLRLFRNILVHPTQEMRDPDGAFFRGGPDWPRFGAQVLARHCWGAIPRRVDRKPLPACPEWPYFEPRFLPVFWPHLGIDPRLSPRELEDEIQRLAAVHRPLPEQTVESVDSGIWCGPISLHFGHMVADFSMRIAGSSRLEAAAPLVFSVPPFREPEPPPHFWQIISHFGIDRRRVLLVRKPTRFGRLCVLPQAERPFGGRPSAQHLELMDAMVGSEKPPDRDLDCVFISRSRLPVGRFLGESYLDKTLAASGAAVLHPETEHLHAQFQMYRRARLLIFSEGSAVHTLQLLGHLDCDVVILVRRPKNQIGAASLRPRARSLRYLPATRALLHGLTRSGRPDTRAGMSVLDDGRLLAGLKSLEVDLAPFWDPAAYGRCRDLDLESWQMQRRAAQTHPRDLEFIDQQINKLSSKT
jgi:hypothetical protein